MNVLFPGATGSARLDFDASPAKRVERLALVFPACVFPLGVIDLLTARSHPGLSQSAAFGGLLLMCLASLGVYFICSRGIIRSERIVDLGVANGIWNSFLLALHGQAASISLGPSMHGVISWILVFPLLVPMGTKKAIAASLGGAALSPVALWLSVAAGAPAPPPATVARSLLPVAVAALVAPFASRVVYRLSVEAAKAREMGSYRLEELLGQGGMGEVWRARHRMLARDSAVKVIRPEALGAAGPDEARRLLKRFEREAQATAALRSPHTIEVYDYGVAEDGTFYYVTELLEGFSLETLVVRFGPVPPERTVHFLRQVCHSLAEAHHVGLVHRDIKPDNIFACRRGLDLDFVKVLDFGLVKDRKEIGMGLTLAGGIAGTPGYLPPEAILGKSAIDSRTDIYGLGCVAYWLLAGAPVFESANAVELMLQHVNDAPVPPSRRSGIVLPEALERLVLRCLEKDPDRRPQTVLWLLESLDGLEPPLVWAKARAEEWWTAHYPLRESEEGADTPARLRRSELALQKFPP